MGKKQDNGGFILPNLIDNLDLELDFDLNDFNILGADSDADDEEGPGEAQGRIMRPRLDIRAVSHNLTFSNARAFARQVDLSPHARTFAWVDGSFIFGDVLEGLVVERGLTPEEIYISSLSISQENIDSLKTLLLLGKTKKLVLILSAYFYSHEKFNLVPYLYQELDIGDILQVVFTNCHTKIIAVKTAYGNTLTIHGSANLRSSNSIEQIMVERDPELFAFNAHIMDELAERFGTVDHAQPQQYKPNTGRGRKTWQAVVEAAEEGAPSASVETESAEEPSAAVAIPGTATSPALRQP